MALRLNALEPGHAFVLILIVVDVSLWHRAAEWQIGSSYSLNPYCSGCVSMAATCDLVGDLGLVLILIVVDVSLWHKLSGLN